MGAICNMLEATIARRATLRNPPAWLIDAFGGGLESSAGVQVSKKTALQYPPFWAALRVISGTVAALPFIVYRRTSDDGKERLPAHPIYKLLHNRPNEYVDPVTFFETRQAHALAYGNGYAEIQRDGTGRPVALWPLLPNRTDRKIKSDGQPYYEVRDPANQTVELPDYNVLHIKGLGFDGYTGYDVVTCHREAIGYGTAVRQYGARWFSGDGSPSGVLEHPNKLTKDAADRLVESWQQNHSGLTKAHRLQVLEEGMKWNPTGIDPAQAQALDVQKWTVDDCCRIFNIPPHMLASMEHATFSNIEEQNIDFVSRTMLYWFKKWEQEINFKLFMPSERSIHFCEILVAALLRGNLTAQADFFAKGRQWGYLSKNDIRRMLNLNPIGPEGDTYLDPLNMKAAGSEPPVGKRTDEVCRIMRDLIAGQFRRVVIKQSKVGYKADQMSLACRITEDPARAYAKVVGKSAEEADAVVTRAVGEFVQQDLPLDDSHPDLFADRITELLGGNNHARAN